MKENPRRNTVHFILNGKTFDSTLRLLKRADASGLKNIVQKGESSFNYNMKCDTKDRSKFSNLNSHQLF